MQNLSFFLNEEAKSKSQQALMAVALQVREGDMTLDDIKSEGFRAKVKEVVDGDITDKELRDYAETKTDSLPEKK